MKSKPRPGETVNDLIHDWRMHNNECRLHRYVALGRLKIINFPFCPRSPLNESRLFLLSKKPLTTGGSQHILAAIL